jgi:asparagine synthase (glutamine-hydrolysing)
MQDVTASDTGPFDRLEDLVDTGALCSFSYQHFLYTALVGAASASGARVILDGDGGELSASVSPTGYLAELLIRGRWPTLLRELSHVSPGRRGRWPVVRQQIVRPLVPYRILKTFRRQHRFRTLLEYPVQAAFVRDILGPETETIREQVNRLPGSYPDHRKNTARDILLARNDIRQRSHAGFVGYQHARFTYPFLDRRVLEFALAADGQFKQAEGHGRRLLRVAMEGLVPAEILSRTRKVPFCPDYHLRYARARLAAAERLKAFAGVGELDRIVDFGKVFQALETTPTYRENDPMRVDYPSQFLVPSAVYLCYFLHRFGT